MTPDRPCRGFQRTRPARGRRIALLLAVTIGACAAAPSTPADPLDTLNHSFRTIYAQARARSIAAGEPYLIVTFDAVILHARGAIASDTYTPALYHQYKNVAHAILTAFCLSSLCADPLRQEDVALVESYVRELDAARAHVAADGFPDATRDRQTRILAGAARYLDSVLQARRVDLAARDAALRALAPDVMANVGDAARVQLDDLNRAVTSLTRDLGAAERRALHVVVIGTHQARDRYLQLAYFRKALGEPGPVEDRLVFCELEFSQAPALAGRAEQLLGTHLLDAAASAAIFGDAGRLQSDILADEAARHVQSMDVPALR